MATRKTPAKKTTKAKPVVARSSARKLPRPQYKSFRLSKRLKHPSPKLPSGYKIFKASFKHIWAHKKLFGGILAVYLLLLLLFVRGFGLIQDLDIFKASMQELIAGSPGKLAASLTVFGILVTSANPTDEIAATYQTLLTILFSLVMIWALRQVHAGERITVRDAFYKSMYPLVPFLLILLVLGLQTIPITVAAFLYSNTVDAGLVVGVLEKVLWLLLYGLLVLWSLYMFTSTVFALYVVTLPDMTPIKALRSTRGLVQFRRWTIMRKVLFLPFILMIIGLIIMLPIILIATPVAEIIFLLLVAAAVPVVHSYGYTLYRELLK